MLNLNQTIKSTAHDLGFDVVGITSAAPFLRRGRIAMSRLKEGLMADLPWYTPQRVHRGGNPRLLLPGARSIISVAMSYMVDEPRRPSEALTGRVARYAWGIDYHLVMKKRLKALVKALSLKLEQPVQAKIYVDDGPMQDRAVAERAGIGWFGKNTNILTQERGSWVFLGQLITDLELTPETPVRKSCGRCTLCMPACPTGAIIAPYVIDSNRCISYHTIENRGSIPRDIRPLMGDWVFGCDICQEVCPVNRSVKPTSEPAFQPRTGFNALELIPILTVTEAQFQERFAQSPIRRAKRVGLQRNACIALGNIGDAIAVPALAKALSDGEPLVRGHAAWALGRIGGQQAQEALESVKEREGDSWVREEIALALKEARAKGSDMVSIPFEAAQLPMK